MSTPIPEDVMKAAEIDAREAVRDAMIDPLMPMQFPIARYIARAVMREREAADERAAKIAETEGVYPELNVWAGGPEWYRHGKRIASAIRDRSKT